MRWALFFIYWTLKGKSKGSIDLHFIRYLATKFTAYNSKTYNKVLDKGKRYFYMIRICVVVVAIGLVLSPRENLFIIFIFLKRSFTDKKTFRMHRKYEKKSPNKNHRYASPKENLFTTFNFLNVVLPSKKKHFWMHRMYK